ncbi:hypothetical protein JGUZn3_10980 [Entomobacter blattae]|uniref:Cytidylate kinase n=1 Tax=Entomobacter blattae TaxID=2762277 RepID=A0A7H1NRB6_9PROT|nr:hypothetical protein JGUZn3_10980 [Entomobacter blattae]
MARNIASALKIPYFDTDLLYRAVARKVLDEGVDPQIHSAEEHVRLLEEGDLRGCGEGRRMLEIAYKMGQ